MLDGRDCTQLSSLLMCFLGVGMNFIFISKAVELHDGFLLQGREDSQGYPVERLCKRESRK